MKSLSGLFLTKILGWSIKGVTIQQMFTIIEHG
jgi:hypothetical protein